MATHLFGRRTDGPVLAHLADRVARRLRAKDRRCKTVTVRVCFADLRAITRALTLPAPICATATLADVTIDLVRGVLADHRGEATISLLAICASHLTEEEDLQLDLPFCLADAGRARVAALRACGPTGRSTRSGSASGGRR